MKIKKSKEQQLLDVLRQVYELIHPDTTPAEDEVWDGELLDMVYDLVAPIVEGESMKTKRKGGTP